MPDQPDLAQSSSVSSPNREDIRGVRLFTGLSQTAAAALVHSSCRSWQQWEAGDRRMHPAFFELFRIKAAQVRSRETVLRNKVRIIAGM